MLNVKTLAEVDQIVIDHFGELHTEKEDVCLSEALHRVLAEDIVSKEYVPGFDRSTVDGYAVIASDVFGCSESIPAILDVIGKVAMGQAPEFSLSHGQCAYVPTGGQLPDGADAMVMIEYTEEFDDHTVGILKASAPGQHIIFRGDDIKEGAVILEQEHTIEAKEIGILAALGMTTIPVYKRPVVGVISTGDELIQCDEPIEQGKIRDINSPMLCAAIKNTMCDVISFGIVVDQYIELKEVVSKAISQCDVLVISGGTSVGEKDATHCVLNELGTLLVHGIAIKPGKPTILGKVKGKPVFGLPGHPVAAYFIYHLLTANLLYRMQGIKHSIACIDACLSYSIPSNNGREECIAVKLEKLSKVATPIVGKSGLISTLTNADGFVRIPRDCEGYSKGSIVTVYVLV